MHYHGVKLNLDLEHYLKGKGFTLRDSPKSYMICCPFHQESDPSLGVNKNNGTFHCFACHRSGNFAELVLKLEHFDDVDEAEDWLINNFGEGSLTSLNEPLELEFEKITPRIDYIGEDILKTWDYRHPYLEGRGIPDVWQRRFRVGYDPNELAITLPWFNRHNECVGVKKRSVVGKAFWTVKAGELGPSSLTLYGMNHVYRRKETQVIITESEIDCLYVRSHVPNYGTLALGTSRISYNQLNELKNSYVQKVLIATDNDMAGQKAANELLHKLNWITDVQIVDWSLFPKVKDVNDLTSEQLNVLVNSETNNILLNF